MDLTTLLRIYAGCARRAITKRFIPASCVASTAITIDVLAHYGWQATPYPVGVCIKNARYRELEARLGRPLFDDERRLAFLTDKALFLELGTTTALGPDSLGGHLVARVGREFLVDASIDQVHAKHPDLQLPSVFLGAIHTPSPGPSETYFFEHMGIGLWYCAKPTTVDFRSLPDWGPSSERTEVVDLIIGDINGYAANHGIS